MEHAPPVQARATHSLVVLSQATFASYDLPARGVVIIGRSETSDIRVDDPSVSRRHARLHLGDRIQVEDLGSINGVRVRDRRLEPEDAAEITAGEPFYVGTVMFILQSAAADAQPPLASAEDVATRRADYEGMAAPEAKVSPERRAAASRGASAGALRIVYDPAMRELYTMVERFAAGSINVLVEGETGVGKELVAARVHESSSRRDRPFLKLNCAALTESLLEGELFGYERGAFTGAHQAKAGLLESANGGTVFLDEIGELSLPSQAKILRVLESREVLRVGALKPRAIDVRFVSATNRPLEAEVRAGRFREDLYFRLNGGLVHLPPLRERTSEIVPLANAFLQNACRNLGRARAPSLGGNTISLLERYVWPGNVRQLRNFIERAVLLAAGPELLPEHFPLAQMAAALPHQRLPHAEHSPDVRPLPEAPASVPADAERQRILDVLSECGGNQSRAAKALNMARSTLVARLDSYAVPRPRKPQP